MKEEHAVQQTGVWKTCYRDKRKTLVWGHSLNLLICYMYKKWAVQLKEEHGVQQTGVWKTCYRDKRKTLVQEHSLNFLICYMHKKWVVQLKEGRLLNCLGAFLICYIISLRWPINYVRKSYICVNKSCHQCNSYSLQKQITCLIKQGYDYIGFTFTFSK